MKLYRLYAAQSMAVSKREAWDFLSNPANLKIISPENMGFNIIYGAETKMFAGQIISYKIAPFSGYTTKWVTEITHVQDGVYFVDEQKIGPYALWHHKHFIREVQGGIRMVDIIDYKLPLGILGELLHSLLVKKQLQKIFRYREKKLTALFGSIPDTSCKLTFKTV